MSAAVPPGLIITAVTTLSTITFGNAGTIEMFSMKVKDFFRARKQTAAEPRLITGSTSYS
jgi:hypothetical protein